jgi:hypothetical protein
VMRKAGPAPVPTTPDYMSNGGQIVKGTTSRSVYDVTNLMPSFQ